MTLRSQNRYVVECTSLPWIRRDVWAWLGPQFLRPQRLWHKPPRQPPRLRRPQRTRRSQAQNAVRKGVAGEPSAGRSAARTRGAAARATHRTRRATGRSRRHPGRYNDHRAKKIVRSFGPAQKPGRLTGGPGSPYRSPPAPGCRHTGASRASLPAAASVVPRGNAPARQASVHAQGFMNSDL